MLHFHWSGLHCFKGHGKDRFPNFGKAPLAAEIMDKTDTPTFVKALAEWSDRDSTGSNLHVAPAVCVRTTKSKLLT